MNDIFFFLTALDIFMVLQRLGYLLHYCSSYYSDFLKKKASAKIYGCHFFKADFGFQFPLA